MFYKLFLHIFALIIAAILHIFIGILTYFYTFLKIFALGYGAPPLGVHRNEPEASEEDERSEVRNSRPEMAKLAPGTPYMLKIA